ncbi:MAG: FAD-binding oxidoreductase [Candidatus Eremiobacteraeota bacterium]|nr:FAD-binding oxidoreductase [Candidatus Eremiobacteraeota bacterium]
MIQPHPASLSPTTISDLQTALREANSRGEAVLVEGGKTLSGMGYPPERHDVVVHTTGLCALNAYAFADLTVSIQAGMTVRALRALLAEHSQFVPLDVPRTHEATIGGSLASGWLGPRRHLFGRARDYVIGSQIVLADGTMAVAGGMVVKNVTGYDMSKLYIGSFGTLGVLASANFKTLPMPAHARAFMAKLPEDTRLRAMAGIQQLAITPSAALWIHGFRKGIPGDEGPDGRIFVLLEGSAALIERATRDLRSALGRAGVPETTILDDGALEAYDRILDAYVASIGERSITYRVLGPADEIDAHVRGGYGCAREHELAAESIIDIINGDLYLRVNGKDAHAFSERIEAFDDDLHAQFPKALIVAGDSPMRANLEVWGQLPDGIERMRALKMQFDPNRTLNPGRFIGRI